MEAVLYSFGSPSHTDGTLTVRALVITTALKEQVSNNISARSVLYNIIVKLDLHSMPLMDLLKNNSDYTNECKVTEIGITSTYKLHCQTHSKKHLCTNISKIFTVNVYLISL